MLRLPALFSPVSPIASLIRLLAVSVIALAWPVPVLTSLPVCCAANVVAASVAREPDAYCDCSNRTLDDRRPLSRQPCGQKQRQWQKHE